MSWLHWRKDSSNLLVDRTYSIVALRTFVLALVSNELLPKRRVFIKTGSQRSRRLLLIFPMVLRNTSFSNICWTVKKIFAKFIQDPNYNYRTGLKNLENYVWICAPVSNLDQAAVLW